MIEEVIRQQILTEKTLHRQYNDGQYMALNHSLHQLDEESRESLFREQMRTTLLQYFIGDTGRGLTCMSLMPYPHRVEHELQIVFGSSPDEKLGRSNSMIDFAQVETLVSLYNPRTKTCVRIMPIYSLDTYIMAFLVGCEYKVLKYRGKEYIDKLTKALELETASTQSLNSTILAYAIQYFLTYGRTVDMAENYFNTH